MHLTALHHIIRYLKRTLGHGLLFSSDFSLALTTFADAGHARCLDTRHSTTGWCILLGSSPISWKCKKQDRDSKSSTEVESSHVLD